jgi:hypothetical protein
MDGPAHLYNSNLIYQIIRGDSSEIATFFSVHSLLIPNWTGHLILTVFNAFLPAWMAEKILLVFYITGLSISFRLLIRELVPTGEGLSVFIFPFAYSFLFHLGFYNYCFSFVFLFITLYYWLKTYRRRNLPRYIILFALLALTYYSALLTFFFTGLCLGIFTTVFYLKAHDGDKAFSAHAIKHTGRELLYLLVTSLPLLVLAADFVHSVQFSASADALSLGDLIKWLCDVRCLIVYNYSGEEVFTSPFLYIAIAIASVSLFIRFYVKRGCLFQKADVLLLPCLLALLLFFIVPTGAGAGMMSDRYCLLFYMFFITWIAAQNLPVKMSRVFAGLIVLLHMGLLLKHHNETIRSLNNHAVLINNASEHMQNNSIVLPVNMSDNWLELHFSNYLGVDKPLVILENYEASMAWFPVKWNDNMPRIQLGTNDTIAGVYWFSNITSQHTRPIDYVFLYGNTQKIDEAQWQSLNKTLIDYYKLTFSSTDHYVAIYTLKKEEQQ